MESGMIDFAKEIAEISNSFEKNNSRIKRLYLIRNIIAFNTLAGRTGLSRGTFGTGYPFYALPKGLTGQLPVVKEQIRYNNELVDEARKSQLQDWTCKDCITRNYSIMPDLKQICKPCPNTRNSLKPRKIINRLPDIDMWIICEDGQIEQTAEKLGILLQEANLLPSDIDPLQTIESLKVITEEIQKGVMPKPFLPIDAHIIEYSKIKDLILRVPLELEQASERGQIPYLPIHPLSYRKKWQYDDEAYNFVHDFLYSFTEIILDKELQDALQASRESVVKSFSVERLYELAVTTGLASVTRRQETPELEQLLQRRINLWKKQSQKENKRHEDGSEEGDDQWQR